MTTLCRCFRIAVPILLLTLFGALAPTATSWADGEVDKAGCSLKGIRLYGKVQVVDSFPDLTVATVTSFPDLKVEKVHSFPDRCGKWEFVKSFPDFKIKYVTSFPDLKIQFVTAFPGVP